MHTDFFELAQETTYNRLYFKTGIRMHVFSITTTFKNFSGTILHIHHIFPENTKIQFLTKVLAVLKRSNCFPEQSQFGQATKPQKRGESIHLCFDKLHDKHLQ